jgi:hypothetical protein
MFFKSKLMLSMLFSVVLIQPAFAMGETNDILMPKGMWKDPATGLIWDRCSLGQMWNGATCIGNVKKYNFFQALSAAKQSTTGEFTDWQLPSAMQLDSIIKCANKHIGYDIEVKLKTFPDGSGGNYTTLGSPGCGGSNSDFHVDQAVFPKHQFASNYWSSTTAFILNDGTVGDIPDHGSECYFNNSGICEGSNGTGGWPYKDRWASVRLVRLNESLGREAIVKAIEARINQARELKRMYQLEQQLEQIEQLKKAQLAQERAKKESEAYDRRVADFRKSVKEGDDASQGVVVQVKGNLVKIQTNDSQCSQRNYNGSCTNYINTPVEKWFKRSEIYPK